MSTPANEPAPPDEAPVLPEITRDEQDVGWGDRRPEREQQRRHDEWLQRERPPHHEG